MGDTPDYSAFLPDPLLAAALAAAEPCDDVPGLVIAAGLRARFAAIETADALAFVCDVYRDVRAHLARVLAQRRVDRAFLDAETRRCVAANGAAGRSWLDPDYVTAIGTRDATGRVVVGPHPTPCDARPADVPLFLRGDQVTLFGPPDTAKMAINAMNAIHRRLSDEPPMVARLIDEAGQVPRWGADDEDSKTPIMANFLQACENLIRCFDGTIALDEGDRSYRLAEDRLSLPIKRIPGLALPDATHLFDGEPLPLHIVDLALHLFHNATRPEALVFYVPKLENEEEAAYVRALIEAAETRIRRHHPGFEPGTIRILVVFENPRAIFRIREIADALHPHFIGGSLGWHDFLASTARLFRHEPAYRIPVKADPNIVVDHILESHRLLHQALAPLGAMQIGGMYGVLFEDGNPRSFQVSMVGFVRDVVVQLRRGLDGFWVAHPAFVRIGLALVAAWRRTTPDDDVLGRLIAELVPDDEARRPLVRFVHTPDPPGLDATDPRYLRAVLAADLAESPMIANNHPDEIRYNVFQALQYLADWLCGNGCVALPAQLRDHRGEPVFVRIMDDLATTERSRWELWAEVQHGRFGADAFLEALDAEARFLRQDVDTPTRRIQVRWRGDAARWYPVARQVLAQLVLSADPPEFVSELILPFTLDALRQAADPWERARAICPGRYEAIRPLS